MVYYLVLYDNSTIDSVIVSIDQCPGGAKLLVDGDLNANLDGPKGNNWDEEITADLMADVL